MTTTIAPNYGVTLAMATNFHGEWDIDPTGRLATGLDVLVQRLINRQTTALGSVLDVPNDCFDVTDWMSLDVTDAELQKLPATIQQELVKDQEVLAVAVSLTFTPSNSTLTIVENIQSAQGPFSLTLTVTPSSVTALVGQITGQGT